MTARHLLRVQEILGRKWELIILTRLGHGPLRHKDLGRRVREIDSGLNDGVFSRTLRRLANDGLIYKQAIGKRHAHALTDLGQEIVAVLTQIADLQDETRDANKSSSDDATVEPER